MVYYQAETERFPVGVALHGGGRFLFFGEVEIFFAFPDALLHIAKGEVIYMLMTWEEFFLFCTLLLAVIRLIMDIYNKKR